VLSHLPTHLTSRINDAASPQLASRTLSASALSQPISTGNVGRQDAYIAAACPRATLASRPLPRAKSTEQKEGQKQEATTIRNTISTYDADVPPPLRGTPPSRRDAHGNVDGIHSSLEHDAIGFHLIVPPGATVNQCDTVVFHALQVRMREFDVELGYTSSAKLQKGLLQNFVAFEQKGKKKGQAHGVAVCGRRYQALALLHAQGCVADDYPVPVTVIAREQDVTAGSLTENVACQKQTSRTFCSYSLPAKSTRSMKDVLAVVGGFTDATCPSSMNVDRCTHESKHPAKSS
jgi:hypothetical protein